MSEAHEIELWVVTYRPRDLPGWDYVARRQIMDARPDHEPNVRYSAPYGFKHLGLVHEFMENMGMGRIKPWPSDDPVIVEVWL